MFQSANKQYRIPKLQQDPLWFTLPKPGHSSSFSVWFPHPSSWRRCSFFIVIIETSTATVPRCFRVFFHDMWNPPPKKHIYYWRIHRRNVPLTLSGVFRRRLFSLIWRLQNGVKARTMSILNTTGSAYASNGNPETKPFWRNQTKKNEFAEMTQNHEKKCITTMTLSDMSSSQRWATDFWRGFHHSSTSLETPSFSLTTICDFPSSSSSTKKIQPQKNINANVQKTTCF